MEESGDSQDISDEYPSSTDDYSSSSQDLDPDSIGHSWSFNNQTLRRHLPPPVPSRPNLSLQQRPPISSTSEATPTSRPHHNHPEPSPAPSVSRNLPLPRQYSQFDLPNFPLPTAHTESVSLPYTSGIDHPASIFDLPPGWSDWDGVISPLSRPASRVSWASNESWHLPFSRIGNDFVDLTDDLADSEMPPARNKRGLSRTTPSAPSSNRVAESSNKRRKTDGGGKRGAPLKVEDSDIEEVDLRDVDDDNGLSNALQKQQEMAIKAQQGATGDKPLKLSSLQCIICLEHMTDVTATSCGQYLRILQKR